MPVACPPVTGGLSSRLPGTLRWGREEPEGHREANGAPDSFGNPGLGPEPSPEMGRSRGSEWSQETVVWVWPARAPLAVSGGGGPVQDGTLSEITKSLGQDTASESRGRDPRELLPEGLPHRPALAPAVVWLPVASRAPSRTHYTSTTRPRQTRSKRATLSRRLHLSDISSVNPCSSWVDTDTRRLRQHRGASQGCRLTSSSSCPVL